MLQLYTEVTYTQFCAFHAKIKKNMKCHFLQSRYVNDVTLL